MTFVPSPTDNKSKPASSGGILGALRCMVPFMGIEQNGSYLQGKSIETLFAKNGENGALASAACTFAERVYGQMSDQQIRDQFYGGGLSPNNPMAASQHGPVADATATAPAAGAPAKATPKQQVAEMYKTPAPNPFGNIG